MPFGVWGAVVQTWIFQGNPDQFDLDAYLGTSPTQLPWLVTRYAQQIEVGDWVFHRGLAQDVRQWTSIVG